jgi:hypothetical protein
MIYSDKKVNIYGREIKVSFVDAIEGKEGVVGDSLYSDGLIRIKRGQREHEFRTLIHEMVHLAIIDNGMANLLCKDNQESLCDFVQHFITQVYEKNRKIINDYD